jgi:hypothetical protein
MLNINANNIVDNYFRFINDWDIESKKELIKKITDSLYIKNNDKSDFSSCFGAWSDNRTADEIINEIYDNRVNHKEIEVF